MAVENMFLKPVAVFLWQFLNLGESSAMKMWDVTIL